MTSLQQELHNYIDCIAEKELLALKPLLFMLSGKNNADTITIEANLTEEEISIIEDAEKEIADGKYTDFDEYMKERGILYVPDAGEKDGEQ